MNLRALTIDMRLQNTKTRSLFFALAATAAISLQGQTPTPEQCQTRVNDTAAKLVECMQIGSLWAHLTRFQVIADQNPDARGHGNRDTGTSGYLASVAYVEGLMQQAGYAVTVQPYPYTIPTITGTPELSIPGVSSTYGEDWFVPRLSAPGVVDARLATVGGDRSGCESADFSAFPQGNIALLARSYCPANTQVANAAAAHASAVILYNSFAAAEAFLSGGADDGSAYEAKLAESAAIPVIAMASAQFGYRLTSIAGGEKAPSVHIDIKTASTTGIDYNLIADSSFGDPNHVVIAEGHLDSIYGAGMLDNASGSTTLIDIALNMANTPTVNQLRYIWFGGEEIDLLGSAYYVRNLSPVEKQKIAFDVDIDVTATPNFDYLVADPTYAPDADKFPPNVIPGSAVGNQFMKDYLNSINVPVRSAWFGNEGTDSISFAFGGIPNTGILTQQDCCKSQTEVTIWGGYLGNYEGKIPGFNGGCVDQPNRWCDNLSNNDPDVFSLASKASAYAVWQLANNAF